MFVCGDNSFQMLGAATQASSIPKVTPISCFPFHNYIIKDVLNIQNSATILHLRNKFDGKSELFGCGNNTFGLLTTTVLIYEDTAVTFLPMDMQDLESKQIIHIAAGADHILVQTDDLQLYGIGFNDCGNLGIGIRNRAQRWTKVAIPASVFKYLHSQNSSDVVLDKYLQLHNITCGFNHTVFLLANKRHLLTCGENRQLQLGYSGCPEALTPQEVDISRFLAPHQRIKKVSACDNFTLLLTEDGVLFGTNNFTNNSDSFSKVELPKLIDVSSSAYGVACLTSDLKVLFRNNNQKTHNFGKSSSEKTWMQLNLKKVNKKLEQGTSFAVDSNTQLIFNAGDIILNNSKNQVVALNNSTVFLYHDFGASTSQRIVVSTGGHGRTGLRFHWQERSYVLVFGPKSRKSFLDLTIGFQG